MYIRFASAAVLLWVATSTFSAVSNGDIGTVSAVDPKGAIIFVPWGKTARETVSITATGDVAVTINMEPGRLDQLKEGMWIKFDETTPDATAKKISAGQFLTKDGDKVAMFKGLPEEFFLASNSAGWYTNEIDGLKFKAQQMSGPSGASNTGMNFRAAGYKEPESGFVVYVPLSLKGVTLNHGGPKPGSMTPDAEGRVFINKDTVTENYWKHSKNPAKPEEGFTTGLTELTMRKFPKRDSAGQKPDVRQPRAEAQAPDEAAPKLDKQGMPDARFIKRHEGFLADVKNNQNAGLVLIGDFLTDDWRGNSKNGVKAIFDHTFGAYGPLNLGQGGDYTQHVLWRLENGELDGLAPKVVMLLIGGTNGSNGDRPEKIAAGIEAIIAGVKMKSPATKFLLVSVPPRAEKQGTPRDRQMAVNPLLVKLNDDTKGIRFIDLAAKFIQPDGIVSKDLMPDFYHLSDKGYQVWADTVAQPLKELMQAK